MGETVHATCIAIDGVGVLFRGPSGAGKSDLALRLIDRGARLVADDRVVLRRAGERVLAAPPAALAGLIEVRGYGPIARPHMAEVPLGLLVDLLPLDEIERLPSRHDHTLIGVPVRAAQIDPARPGAEARVRQLAGAGAPVLACPECPGASAPAV